MELTPRIYGQDNDDKESMGTYEPVSYRTDDNKTRLTITKNGDGKEINR